MIIFKNILEIIDTTSKENFKFDMQYWSWSIWLRFCLQKEAPSLKKSVNWQKEIRGLFIENGYLQKQYLRIRCFEIWVKICWDIFITNTKIWVYPCHVVLDLNVAELFKTYSLKMNKSSLAFFMSFRNFWSKMVSKINSLLWNDNSEVNYKELLQLKEIDS